MNLTERDEARFWSKVALPNREGCMLWTAYVDTIGYGRFGLHGKMAHAHRVSYTLAYGPIPESLVIDHVLARGCTNRHCVAPLHLEAVTHRENLLRANVGANMRAKTHCPQGHPYSGENLVIVKGGFRRCRTCNREHDRAYRRRKAA
ncbi:MAG: HNH endonuclease signature motif containing protein [Humibacter sp.]